MVCKVGTLKSTAESNGILFFPPFKLSRLFFIFSKPGTIIPEQDSPIPDTTSLRQHSGEPPLQPSPSPHRSILGPEGNSELSLGWGVCRGWEEYTNEAVEWIAVCVYRNVCVVQVLTPLWAYIVHIQDKSTYWCPCGTYHIFSGLCHYVGVWVSFPYFACGFLLLDQPVCVQNLLCVSELALYLLG